MTATNDIHDFDLTGPGPADSAEITDPDLEYLDPDLAPVDEASTLELLRGAVTKKVVPDEVTYRVPRRDGIKVRYTTAGLDPRKYSGWQRRCTDNKGIINSDRLHGILLSTQCTGIFIDGTLVTEDGEPLTFRDKTIRTMVGADNAGDTVRLLFGGPAKDYGMALAAHANELLDAAGVGDDLQDDTEADPT